MPRTFLDLATSTKISACLQQGQHDLQHSWLKKKTQPSKKNSAKICRANTIFCLWILWQLKAHGHNPWKKGRPGMAFGERRIRALQCNSELRVDWKCCPWAGMHKGAGGFHWLDSRVWNAHGFSSWGFKFGFWIQKLLSVVINYCIFYKTSLCSHHWWEDGKFWEFFAKITQVFSLSSTTLCKSESRADLGSGGQSKQLLFYNPDMFNFFPPFF